VAPWWNAHTRLLTSMCWGVGGEASGRATSTARLPNTRPSVCCVCCVCRVGAHTHTPCPVRQYAAPGPRRTGSPVPTQRLPLLNYEMVKDTMLRDKLGQYGLPTQGSKKTLVDRHQDFVHRFNAETDSANPRCV
jgi:hypothetical protein